MEQAKEKWIGIWNDFEEKHPKLSKWVYQIFYFFVFSMMVTVFQYLVFTFMPGMLGNGLAGINEATSMVSSWISHGVCLDIMCCGMVREPSSLAGDWGILSAMRWGLSWHSALIFHYREILLLRVMEIHGIRRCGILLRGL